MEHKAAKKNFFSIWECIAFQVSKHYPYLKTRNLIIWTIKSWNYSGCKKAWGLLVQPLAQSSVGYLIRPGLLGLSSVRSWKPLRTEILQPLPLFRVFLHCKLHSKYPRKHTESIAVYRGSDYSLLLSACCTISASSFGPPVKEGCFWSYLQFYYFISTN